MSPIGFHGFFATQDLFSKKQVIPSSYLRWMKNSLKNYQSYAEYSKYRFGEKIIAY